MKEIISTAAGVGAGVLSWLVGGFDTPLWILIVCMGVDYVTGLLVAGVFHTSPKSGGGGLDSQVGWKGLSRKAATLLLVVLGHCVDELTGTNGLCRNAVIIGFCANEGLSVLENCGLMGLPIPKFLHKSLSDLMERAEGAEKEGIEHD